MKKHLALAMATLTAVSALTGCVGASAGKSAVAPETKQEVAKSSAENGGSESAEASDGSVPGEITVMVNSSFTGMDDPAIMRAAKAFEEQNPGTKVTIEGLAGQELISKFTTTAMAGSGPDVVALDNSGWPIDLAAMGLIMPLDDKIEASDNKYLQGPLESGLYEGNYYSVPWY